MFHSSRRQGRGWKGPPQVPARGAAVPHSLQCLRDTAAPGAQPACLPQASLALRVLGQCWGCGWPRRGGRAQAYSVLDRLLGGSGRRGGSSVSGCAVGDTDSRTPAETSCCVESSSPAPRKAPCPSRTPGWTDRPDSQPAGSKEAEPRGPAVQTAPRPRQPLRGADPGGRKMRACRGSGHEPDGWHPHAQQRRTERGVIPPSKGREQQPSELRNGTLQARSRPEGLVLRGSLDTKHPHGQTLGDRHGDRGVPAGTPRGGRGQGRRGQGRGCSGGTGGGTGPEPGWISVRPPVLGAGGRPGLSMCPPSGELCWLRGHSPYSCQTRTRSS